MSCPTCGRHDGHWLGCRAALREHARNLVEPDFSASASARCLFGDCANPKRAARGKGGARPKYCEEHSDPKNRK
jgi:hypothetical protein